MQVRLAEVTTEDSHTEPFGLPDRQRIVGVARLTGFLLQCTRLTKVFFAVAGPSAVRFHHVTWMSCFLTYGTISKNADPSVVAVATVRAASYFRSGPSASVPSLIFSLCNCRSAQQRSQELEKRNQPNGRHRRDRPWCDRRRDDVPRVVEAATVDSACHCFCPITTRIRWELAFSLEHVGLIVGCPFGVVCIAQLLSRSSDGACGVPNWPD